MSETALNKTKLKSTQQVNDDVRGQRWAACFCSLMASNICSDEIEADVRRILKDCTLTIKVMMKSEVMRESNESCYIQ